MRIAAHHHRRVVHQIRRLREKRVCEQIHTAQLPRAVLRIARDVLKAILVPRLVVLHPDPLRLAHGEPAQANHLLQRRPRLLVAVARLHCELSRRSVALEGMERQRERRHPLATRVIEGHLPVVATGVAHHHALRRLVRRAGGVPADSRGSDGEVHHARDFGNAEQVQGAVEHGGGLRGLLRDESHHKRVGSHLEVVLLRGRVGGDRLHGQGDVSIAKVGVGVAGGGGGRDGTHKALTEHFHAVQKDHTPVLEAERKNQSRNTLQNGHVERLLVQLELVRRGGEGARRADRPIREGAPILGYFAHRILPRAPRRD